MTSSESNFAKEKIPLLLSGYKLYYYKEDDRYFDDKGKKYRKGRDPFLGLTGLLPASPAWKGGVKGSYIRMF